MSKRHNAFRTTKVKLSEFPKDKRDHFEQLFVNLEAAKSDAVKADRAAEIAASNAAVKKAMARTAELNILLEASDYDKRIEVERHWTVFRDNEGQVTFEGITERILRNATRMGLQQMGQNADEGTNDLNLEMFEGNDEQKPPNEDDEGEGHKD